MGKGSLVLIGGEPGVGKTRLCEETLSHAKARGFLTLTGHCYEMDGAPPFIPWVESLDHASRLLSPNRFREVLGTAAPELAKLMPELRRLYDDIADPIELPPEQQRRYLFKSFEEVARRLTGDTSFDATRSPTLDAWSGGLASTRGLAPAFHPKSAQYP